MIAKKEARLKKRKHDNKKFKHKNKKRDSKNTTKKWKKEKNIYIKKMQYERTDSTLQKQKRNVTTKKECIKKGKRQKKHNNNKPCMLYRKQRRQIKGDCKPKEHNKQNLRKKTKTR